MNEHEAFLKALRTEPNDPFHERVYCDFLLDQGYHPPEEFVRIARRLAPHLHSALRSLYLPRDQLGTFGVEVLLSCSHLDNLCELYLPGFKDWQRGPNRAIRHTARPNIGEEGVVRLVASPLMRQIAVLDLRYNNVGRRGTDALVSSPHLGGLLSLVVEEPASLSLDDWDRLEERFGWRLQGHR